MDWINNLVFGSGVAHSIFLVALTIFAGIALGKIKIAGISLGVTWILFVGITLSHFDMVLEEHTLHFVKNFDSYCSSTLSGCKLDQDSLHRSKKVA